MIVNNIIGGLDDDKYAWAQRLRNIPDKDALSEMAMMGYMRSDSDYQSFRKYNSRSFTGGTGSGKRQRRSSRAGASKNRR